MAILQLLHYPDPRLRTVAKPVNKVDQAVRQIAADMAETMYAAPGIGLAATQVNIHKRIIVIDITENQSDLHVLINPEVRPLSSDVKVHQEGCLSVPGIYDEVIRPDLIEVKAIDLNGKPVAFQASGLLSVCVQHEIDHLNGKVFVDYLSRLKQNRIASKLSKAEREGLLPQPEVSDTLTAQAISSLSRLRSSIS